MGVLRKRCFELAILVNYTTSKFFRSRVFGNGMLFYTLAGEWPEAKWSSAVVLDLTCRTMAVVNRL